MCYVILFIFILFFFFKQKTAYEMRISDWSSDVCSSDLKSLRSPVIGQDQFAGRLVAARPVGNFAVPVVLFPWGAHAIIVHGARGEGEAVNLDSFVKVGEFHHGLFLHSGAIGARWMA